MKALRYIFLLGAVGSLLTFGSCGGGGSTPEPVADQQFTKLSKTWQITGANNGTDQITLYNAGISGDPGPMKLTITGTKGTSSTYAYSVSGRPALSPWPKNGKWEFGLDPKQTIVRDKGTGDELTMTYTVSETSLTVSFNFADNKPGYTNPRASVISGSWTYTFTAQ